MVLLAVDIDNSHTELGLLADGEVLAFWRVGTEDRRTSDEWAVLVQGLLAGHPTPAGGPVITGVAVCATVPTVLHAWRAMLGRHFADVPHVIVEPGVRTGIALLVDNPREVGSDRIVNAVAAARTYGAPAIVVDFGGTATTFDVLNAEGQYVGGAIAPGLELSGEALSSRGAQLRQVELVRPRTAIARNTVEALQSGMVLGMASLVAGMVARITAELGEAPGQVRVIATGHLADLVADECGCFTDHSPQLTLRGLELIFQRNA